MQKRPSGSGSGRGGEAPVRESAERLLALVEDTDPLVAQEEPEALTQLRKPGPWHPTSSVGTGRAEPVAALKCLVETGGPAHGEAIAELHAEPLVRGLQLTPNYC